MVSKLENHIVKLYAMEKICLHFLVQPKYIYTDHVILTMSRKIIFLSLTNIIS